MRLECFHINRLRATHDASITEDAGRASKQMGVFVLRIAATGETLCTRRHSSFVDRPFLDVVDILRGADVACTNLETRVHTFKGAPMPVDTMGMEQSYQQADPFVADELKWMGLDLIGRSNNHGMDYGAEMLIEEAEILDRAGLLHAGAGKNLAEATRPTFFETPNGRVGFLSMCTDFPPHCPAGEQGQLTIGRAGINAIHHDVKYEVDDETFASLSRLMTELDMKKAVRDGQVLAFGQVFEKSQQNLAVYTPSAYDVSRNCRAIADAKLASDYVIVHLHQETEGHYPSERIENLARKLIDAGADVIVGDGPHLLQGVEIYNGKPILYSLGNFFYQSETIKAFPPDMYLRGGMRPDALPQEAIEYRDAIRSGRVKKDNIRPLRSGNEYLEWHEAAIADIVFDNGRLSSIRLHAVSTYDVKRSQRGLPRIADAETSARIISNIASYSQPYGTAIRLEGNIGIIDIA